MKLVSVLAFATVLSLSGCLKKSALFCDEDTPCTNPDLPFCDLTGEYPASEGIGRTCIPNPFADAGAPDAAVTFDAGPVRPPVINFQPADLVLGQPDLDSDGARPTSATSLNSPFGIDSDGVRLWVSEVAGPESAPRVVQWDVMPAVNGQAANYVMGQDNLFGEESGVAANRLSSSLGVDGSDERVVVGDRFRVLIWNPVPAANGNSASVVIGQPEFTTLTGSLGQTGFDELDDVCTDGTRIAVSDYWQNRVMIWNSIPTANGVAADIVVGQPNFSSSDEVVPPTRSSLRNPRGLWCDEDRLMVADSGNGRALVWDGWPTVSGQDATVVVSDPRGVADVAVGGGSLFIATGRRVSVYSPVPKVDGAVPSRVLGQPDLNTYDDPDMYAPSALRFSSSRIAATEEALFVVDHARNRVLRFTYIDQ